MYIYIYTQKLRIQYLTSTWENSFEKVDTTYTINRKVHMGAGRGG